VPQLLRILISTVPAAYDWTTTTSSAGVKSCGW
jgi:hypothetical protein